MVTGSDSGHVLPDGLDHSGHFMAKHRGPGERKIAVEVVKVAVADPGGADTHQYLVVGRQVDIDLLHAHWSAGFE
jgi:hypothetical protein